MKTEITYEYECTNCGEHWESLDYPYFCCKKCFRIATVLVKEPQRISPVAEGEILTDGVKQPSAGKDNSEKVDSNTGYAYGHSYLKQQSATQQRPVRTVAVKWKGCVRRVRAFFGMDGNE